MSDIAKFTEDPRMRALVTDLLQVLGGATAPENASGQLFYGDAEVMAEALAFLNALLTEADPAATTNQHLRLSSEAIARKATDYAKAIRAHNQATGQRLIAAFAGADEIIAKPAADGLS